MKLGFIFGVGMVMGIALALALLFINPMPVESDSELGAFDSVLRYGFPGDDVVLLTHAGAAPLPMRPEGVQELWESTVRSAAVAVIALSGEGAWSAAAASRIAVPARQTELLTSGILVDDYWLLSVPGQGSLFVLGDSNVWPVVRDNVLPVSLLNRPWAGPRSYRSTQGPGVRGTALAFGATGRLAGREGSAIDRLHLSGYGRAGVESFTGELHLRLLEPAAEEVP